MGLPTEALGDSLAELSATIDEVRTQLADHQTYARQLPTRILLGDIRPQARRPAGEHSRIVDAVRMATYNAESSLARLLADRYPRARHEAEACSTKRSLPPSTSA